VKKTQLIAIREHIEAIKSFIEEDRQGVSYILDALEKLEVAVIEELKAIVWREFDSHWRDARQ